MLGRVCHGYVDTPKLFPNSFAKRSAPLRGRFVSGFSLFYGTP